MKAWFERSSLPLSEKQYKQIWLFHTLLREKNARYDLTRIYQFDNMAHYLYDDIKERCGGMGSLVVRGPHIIGCFRSRHSGKDLTIVDRQGGKEAKKVLMDFVTGMGWTVRDKKSKEIGHRDMWVLWAQRENLQHGLRW